MKWANSKRFGLNSLRSFIDSRGNRKRERGGGERDKNLHTYENANNSMYI